MAIRLYIGGTEGAQDGEEISRGDMSNPITFDGYDIETGDVSYAQFAKAYLRADEGETWVGVCLKVADISGTEDLHDILIVGQRAEDVAGAGQLSKVILPNCCSFMLEKDVPLSYKDSDMPNTDGAYSLFFPVVTDINSEEAILYLSPLLYLGLKDPNTSIKIIMTGGALKDE